MAKIRHLSQADKIAWLRLIRSENVGVKTFYDLLRVYQTPQKALDAVADLSIRGGRKKPIKVATIQQAEQELMLCEKFDAKIIAYPEPEYPAYLREIPGPPPILTMLGDAALLNKRSIAIVGARNASANGCRFTQHIAESLGNSGYIVVSGLARGIDTYAHQGSLETGTVGVIAGGIDHIYPKENKELYAKMKEKGAILAELPIGSVPMGRNFPQRNRIIAGMSIGTLVVEAAKGSGSLITARFALEQNREVFAVPGSPLDARCRGTNYLIKNGAVMVETVEDIIHAANVFNLPRKATLFEPTSSFVNSEQYQEDEVFQKKIRQEVLEQLSSTPISVDELIQHTGLPANKVIVVLVELELAGRLERHSGNQVSLIYAQESLEVM